MLYSGPLESHARKIPLQKIHPELGQIATPTVRGRDSRRSPLPRPVVITFPPLGLWLISRRRSAKAFSLLHLHSRSTPPTPMSTSDIVRIQRNIALKAVADTIEAIEDLEYAVTIRVYKRSISAIPLPEDIKQRSAKLPERFRR